VDGFDHPAYLKILKEGAKNRKLERLWQAVSCRRVDEGKKQSTLSGTASVMFFTEF
jgi:hypothetical protein